MRAFLIVLDSVGIGAAPDASVYGDEGSNTLAHLAEAAGGVKLPVMTSMGLGNIPLLIPGGIPIAGVDPVKTPIASYGAMKEISHGKDTTTGHWEMAGLFLEKGFAVFPHDFPSFPEALTREWIKRTGRGILGNRAASGTRIIEELGEQQMKTGDWIAYTSADSVFQVAAHEDVIPLEELYEGCRIARELCNEYTVGRVIARPYVGKPGSFTRTENRRDFSYPLPEPCILDHLAGAGVKTVTVGKLDDIFAGAHIDRVCHVENNPDAESCLLSLPDEEQGPVFVFANLIDFDMLYGHRRDPLGYAKALESSDAVLGRLIAKLKPDDLLLVTADHGNDPTFKGTDHTREFVPLLAWAPSHPAGSLGIRQGFYDLAQTLASYFGAPPMPRGRSLWGRS